MTVNSEDAREQFNLAVQLFQKFMPEAFGQAVALTEKAAERDHPEAICQLATIEAVGAGRPADFAKALDLLARSAALGSEAAIAQLNLLGSSKTADLASRISLPPKITLSESPRIRVMEGFSTPEVCDWIATRCREKLGPAMVWDEHRRRGRLDPARTNSAVELGLVDMDVVLAVERARISAATGLPVPIFEPAQVMRYTVGQEFRLHHDYLDPDVPGHASDIERRGQRIATFLIYLNDDFEGGETEFPRAGISFRGKKGDALFFANVSRANDPDPRSIHAGKPPLAGEKWILSQWIRDRAPAMSDS